MAWIPKDKSIKDLQTDLGKLAQSPQMIKILEHAKQCKFCQTIQSSIGWIIEAHMEEELEKEKFT